VSSILLCFKYCEFIFLLFLLAHHENLTTITVQSRGIVERSRQWREMLLSVEPRGSGKEKWNDLCSILSTDHWLSAYFLGRIWLVNHALSANEQYFFLTPNQTTVLLAMVYKPNQPKRRGQSPCQIPWCVKAAKLEVCQFAWTGQADGLHALGLLRWRTGPAHHAA